MQALIESPSVAEAARRANLSYTWAWELLRRPGFMAAYELARATAINQYLCRVNEVRDKALQEMEKILDNEKGWPKDKINAARVLMEAADRAEKTLEKRLHHLSAEAAAQRRGRTLEAEAPKGYRAISPPAK